MKYTNEIIENIITDFERFKEHVACVMQAAGKGNDDIEFFDGIHNDNLRFTTSHNGRCGYETESHDIPLDWLTSDDPEELKAMIAAKREDERRQAAERYQQERLVAEARQKAADLARLAELKAKYEPTNSTTQGELP